MSYFQVSNLKITQNNWHGEFNLSIEKGKWLAILGPSGSGKSTLLEALAGFIVPQNGDIILDDQRLNTLPPFKRNLSYVWQRSSLFPHLTIKKNLLLILHAEKIPFELKILKIKESLSRLQLNEEYLERYPGQISGGELARMNLAQIVLKPSKLLLLDEPFAALDAGLRFSMNALVQEIHKEQHCTIICVTHHSEDAHNFADEILYIENGKTISQKENSECNIYIQRNLD